MEQSISQNLERALADTEADASAALKASEAVVTSVRKFRAAAKSGNLRELHASIEAAEKAIAGLRQQFANAKDGWRFDGEQYIASGDYTKEVVAVAERAGVRIFERDERLYCYPSLIRVSSNEKAVFIDKKRESRIRPSVLVDILKDRQRKPPRFRPENFLAAQKFCPKTVFGLISQPPELVSLAQKSTDAERLPLQLYLEFLVWKTTKKLKALSKLQTTIRK